MKTSLIDDRGSLVKYLDWRPAANHIAGVVRYTFVSEIKKGRTISALPFFIWL